MIAASCLALALLAPQAAGAPAAPVPAPADAPSRGLPPAPEQDGAFTKFGDQVLRKSNLVGEAKIESVATLGRGASVVTCRFTQVLKGDAKATEVVVLAAPGDFAEGSSYLVFLRQFEGGPRYTWLGRIPAAERDYPHKLRVLKQYIAADAVKQPAERAAKVRAFLIENLGDKEVFVKWNALRELKPLAGGNAALFSAADKASIVAHWKAEESPTFRRELAHLLKALGMSLEDERPE